MATDFNNQFDDASNSDKDMKNTLNAWRESVEKQAERPDWFWARQRALLSSQIQQPNTKRVPVLAWAGVAATVALGVALLSPGQKQPPTIVATVGQSTTVQVNGQISDQELMQQLEQTMNSGVPESLQPATTLAQEMEAAYGTNATSKVKERTQ